MTDPESRSKIVRILRLLVVLGIATVVGSAVLDEQRAALERCAPECDLMGIVVAQTETIVLSPVAATRISVGPVPVGAIAMAILCLWFLQFVRTEVVGRTA